MPNKKDIYLQIKEQAEKLVFLEDTKDDLNLPNYNELEFINMGLSELYQEMTPNKKILISKINKQIDIVEKILVNLVKKIERK